MQCAFLCFTRALRELSNCNITLSNDTNYRLEFDDLKVQLVKGGYSSCLSPSLLKGENYQNMLNFCSKTINILEMKLAINLSLLDEVTDLHTLTVDASS